MVEASASPSPIPPFPHPGVPPTYPPGTLLGLPCHLCHLALTFPLLVAGASLAMPTDWQSSHTLLAPHMQQICLMARLWLPAPVLRLH